MTKCRFENTTIGVIFRAKSTVKEKLGKRERKTLLIKTPKVYQRINFESKNFHVV